LLVGAFGFWGAGLVEPVFGGFFFVEDGGVFGDVHF